MKVYSYALLCLCSLIGAMDKEITERKIGELLSLVDTDNTREVIRYDELQEGEVVARESQGLRYCKVIRLPRDPFEKITIQVNDSCLAADRERVSNSSNLYKILSQRSLVETKITPLLGQKIPDNIIQNALKGPKTLKDEEIVGFWNERHNQYQYAQIQYVKGLSALIRIKKGSSKGERAIELKDLYKLNS